MKHSCFVLRILYGVTRECVTLRCDFKKVYKNKFDMINARSLTEMMKFLS